MNTQIKSSDFQRVIETVETLTIDDQFLLVEIIRQRLSQYRRSQLIAEVAEARQAYQAGNVQRGTVDDLLAGIGIGCRGNLPADYGDSR
jgi:hypothetical protein